MVSTWGDLIIDSTELLTYYRHTTRSHLKKVFCPHLCVGRSLQVLEIQTYSSGLNFAAALIWNQNPNFEMTSNREVTYGSHRFTRKRQTAAKYP
jgi:hypothetical protein